MVVVAAVVALVGKATRAKERKKCFLGYHLIIMVIEAKQTEGLFLLQSRIVVWRAMTMKENG